jgi:hypothetical protein
MSVLPKTRLPAPMIAILAMSLLLVARRGRASSDYIVPAGRPCQKKNTPPDCEDDPEMAIHPPRTYNDPNEGVSMNKKPILSRRSFLGRSLGLLGAAAAAPALIPASALGRDGAVAPSERITMGFIGVGTQGGGHLLGGAWTYLTGGYAARKDVQVLAVCDVWRDRRESARVRVDRHYAEIYGQGRYRSCEAYVDFRNILDRPDIDAVLIATPAHWHATMAILAARAGKDIYCEKPTAVTVRESREVQAVVARTGRIYQAGTQQPDRQALRSLRLPRRRSDRLAEALRSGPADP